MSRIKRDTGYLALKNDGGFKVWNRSRRFYENIEKLPDETDFSRLDHWKDLYDIARTYGVLEARRYAVRTSNAFWRKVNSGFNFSGMRL